MARSIDEPDFGEVKGLLRRLETTTQSPAGSASQSFPPSAGDQPRSGRIQQGLSPAAALFLVANTVMTTATVTSIAWYLFHSAEMQRSGKAGAGPAGAPAGAFQWPPRDYAAPSAVSPEASPQSTAAVSARLIGPETFEVAPGQAIRIPLQLGPREAIADADHVSIRGLPSNAILNRGTRLGPDAWNVPVNELPELELFASAAVPPGRFDLVVSAHSKSGHELASARSALVVSTGPTTAAPAPASAPAAAVTTAAPVAQPVVPLDEAAQAKQIAKAREFLGIGQVGAARLLLQRVADAGSAEAALLLGDTYDPVRLFQLGARGLVGDTEKATFWYGRADELGSPEAKARIIGLGRK